MKKKMTWKERKIVLRSQIQLIVFFTFAALYIFCLWNPKIIPGVTTTYTYYRTQAYFEMMEKERRDGSQRFFDLILDENVRAELKYNPVYFQKVGYTTYYSLLPNDLTAFWLLLITHILFCELGVIRNMTSDELEVLRNISSESKEDKKPLRGISHLASVERKIKE